MPYTLPKTLPAELLINGKSYKLVTPKESVRRKVCKSNKDGWFYYFNKAVVDGPTLAIGNKRHFSVKNAKENRSVHISMKSHGTTGPKRDNIMIWYRYDKQWTGNTTEEAGWGRTSFPHMDKNRVDKAVDMLTAFLEAMTAAAEGRAVAVTPCLSPPLSTIPLISSKEWEDFQPEEETFTTSVATMTPTKSETADFDDWEAAADAMGITGGK